MQAGWSRELGIVVEELIPEHQLRMVSVDLTLQPAPPPAARHLYVHLAPFRHDEGDLGSAQVGIPLHPRGPAEDARR